MVWRAESATTPGLLAVEHGQRIAQWTQRVGGGAGSFGQQPIAGSTWPPFGWRNAAGAARGTASYFRSTTQMGFANPASCGHVVHLRLNLHSNRSSSIAIGPATCVHAPGGGGIPGNCYLVEALYVGGTPRVYVEKVTGGVKGVLAVVPYQVNEGDVLSIGYQFGGGTAEVYAYVNGLLVAGGFDSVAAFDMASILGRTGLWGGDDPAISATVGHWSTEWWVTDLIHSYATLPPAPAALSGDLRCEIRTVQRYTDDPADKIKFLLSGEVTKAQWSFRRIGGCQSASLEFRPQQEGVKNPDVVRYFEDPGGTDWDANNWLGGLVVLSGRYSGFNIALNPAIDERLWTGRVTSCEFTRKTGVISLEAEGLAASFDEMQFFGTFTGTIRDAIVHLVRDNLAKGERASPHRATWIRFNPDKITGLGSILDYRINMEFRFEDISSVLDRILRLVPDGFVWGVDRLGEFYLSYQQDNYEDDLGASGTALSILTFDTRNAERWTRKIDLSEIVNQVLVLGADDPTAFNASTKITGAAVAVKSRELWGARQQIVQEDQAADAGIAAKIAQATCRRSAAPRITADLTVTEPIRGTKSFWDSLVAFAPTIAVNDRFIAQNIQETGMPRRAEFNLRRYGDEPAYAIAENGATGWAELAVAAAEEIGQDFVAHQALRFTDAHPGGAGTFVFIFGRPGAAAVRKGWGALYWEKNTGKLWWYYEDAAGTSTGFDTGITVNVTTPANAVVHFSLTRDAFGIWRAYNGGGLTATSGVLANPKTTTGTAWRWFRPLFTSGTDVAWKGTLDQFWFVDGAVVVDGLNEGISGQFSGGYPAFITRNNQRRIRRGDGIGLLSHINFNEDITESFSNAKGHKVWRAAAAEGLGPGVAARTTYSSATSPLTNGTAVTPTGQRGGHLIGRPKRWGGPLRLAVEDVTYELLPRSHRIRRTYSLGEAPASVSNTVARVQEDLRTQAELLQRQGIP